MPNKKMEMKAPISRAPRVGCGSKAAVGIQRFVEREGKQLHQLILRDGFIPLAKVKITAF